MKKFTTILLATLLLLAGFTPSYAQVPERSRLVVPSSTSSSWFRVASDCTTGGFGFTSDTNTLVCNPNADEVAIRTGGTNRLTVSSSAVTSTAPGLWPDGTAAAPSYSFATSPASGLYLPAANNPSMSIGGTRVHNFTSTTFDVLNDSGAFRLGASADVSLSRDAPNTLAQRNGTATQTYRLGPAASYLGIFKANGAAGGIGNVDAFGLELYTANTNRWQINGSGHFLAWADNTYDIGASGATRPRNYYGAGTIDAAGMISSSTRLRLAGQIDLDPISVGVARFSDGAGGFTRLILGTSDASGISFYKNGTRLDFKTGDQVSFIDTVAATITGTSGTITNDSVSWRRGSGSPEGVVTAAVGSFYSRTDGGAGTTLYVKESGIGNTGWVAK